MIEAKLRLVNKSADRAASCNFGLSPAFFHLTANVGQSVEKGILYETSREVIDNNTNETLQLGLVYTDPLDSQDRVVTLGVLPDYVTMGDELTVTFANNQTFTVVGTMVP